MPLKIFQNIFCFKNISYTVYHRLRWKVNYLSCCVRQLAPPMGHEEAGIGKTFSTINIINIFCQNMGL
jgi:hypothetical protein